MADWTTPDAVHSYCCEYNDTTYSHENSIDDDTGTSWLTNNTDHRHWIIFDLGETMTVTKIEIYQSGGNKWGGSSSYNIYVYVSDDPENFGDPVWTGNTLYDNGWNVAEGFEKNGRYVKMETQRTGLYQQMWEFKAYAEAVVGGLSIAVAMHHYGHHIGKIIRG